MAINAYEALLSSYPRLVVQVLDKQESLSTFLQSVFLESVEFLLQERCDIRNLRPYVWADDGHIFVDFHAEREEFYNEDRLTERRVLWRKNPVIAHIMQVNDNVARIAVDVVNVLENWTRANHAKLSIFDLRLENAWVTRGGRRVSADILTEEQFRRQSAKKVGFEDEESTLTVKEF